MKYDFERVVDRTETESIKWVLPRRKLKVEDAIPLWVADMDFAAPPCVAEAIRRRADHGVFGYPATPPSFYQAAIHWLQRRHGWTVQQEWMSLTPGVVAALYFCVRAFSRPGDGIVIQTPVYPPFYHCIRDQERVAVCNPLRFDGSRYSMDLEDLEKKLEGSPRILILCSPHNPVGRVWTREELAGLARLAVERDLLVISDEIHHDLVYPGYRHHVLAAAFPELAERTITCIAPSKTFNIPGLATAAVITSHPDLRRRLGKEARRSGFDGGQIFGMTGFEAAYAGGEDWLEELLPYLQDNIEYMDRFLRERIPGIRLIRPEGTYLALLDCRALGLPPEGLNDFFLKRARVYFSDGIRFGRELEGFVRINFGCPRSTLAEALERMEKAVQGLRSS